MSRADQMHSARAPMPAGAGGKTATTAALTMPTPLFAACSKGHAELAGALCCAGADPNEMMSGITPLLVGILRQDARIVHVLLRAGAEPNLAGADGTLPLMLSLHKDSTVIVDMLLKAGAKAGPSSALMLSVLNGKAEAVDLLLKSGAEIHHFSAALGGTSAASVASLSSPRIQRAVERRAADLEQLLAHAERGETARVVQLLHVSCCSPNDYPPFASVPLFLAAAAGHLPVVQALLSSGALVDTVVGQHKPATALVMACAHGHEDVAQLLCDSGADVDFVSDPQHTSCTPLCWAVLYGHRGVVKLLLAAGAKANFTTRRTLDTPLLFAVERGHADTVELLLAAGASWQHKSRHGVSALELAKARGRAAVVDAVARAAGAAVAR